MPEKIKKVMISQLIDQSKFELIGGVWTDEKGKINFVGLTIIDGHIVPDFPDMTSVYISDAAQVGIEHQPPMIKGTVEMYVTNNAE